MDATLGSHITVRHTGVFLGGIVRGLIRTTQQRPPYKDVLFREFTEPPWEVFIATA